VFTLGIAVHTLAVATKLRVVRGQQDESCIDSVSEGLNRLLITPDCLKIPVRLNRAEIDDANLTDGLNFFFALVVLSDYLAHQSSIKRVKPLAMLLGKRTGISLSSNA
jgi:hypothetical protein